MRQVVVLLVGVVLGGRVLAGSPDAASSTRNRDVARVVASRTEKAVVHRPAPESAASGNVESTDPAYVLRRGTEVTMLWSILAKKSFSAEDLACDYLVERNFEREQPLMNDADFSCGSMDEFTRHDRIAEVVPEIKTEYAMFAKQKVFRVWVTAPIREYDFSRGGYATGFGDRLEAHFIFQHSVDGAVLVLENAGRLGFIQMDEARARGISGAPFWLFELTIRPTGFTEKPFTKSSTRKIIKSTIVRARVFTTLDGNFDSVPSVRAVVKAQSDSPVLETVLESHAQSRR